MGTSDAEWPKMGRPPKKMDWVQFETKCAKQCTLLEIALYFRLDPKTLQSKIKARYGQTFSQVFSVLRVAGMDSLRSKQFDMALTGNKGEGDKDMLKHLDKKYAHLQGDVDPRFYNNGTEVDVLKDNRLEVSVSYVDTPSQAMREKFDNESIADEDPAKGS